MHERNADEAMHLKTFLCSCGRALVSHATKQSDRQIIASAGPTLEVLDKQTI